MERNTSLPRIVKLPDDHPYGKKGIQWNKNTYATYEEAMEARERHITCYDKTYFLIRQVLSSYLLDCPCDICIGYDDTKDCGINPGRGCYFSADEDKIDGLIVEIMEVLQW